MARKRAAATRTVEQRRRQVARLYNADYSVREIRLELSKAGYKNVSRPTVQRDLVILREEWHQANVAAIEGRRNAQAQRLDDDIAHWTRQMFRITDPVEAGKFWVEVIFPALKERAKLLGLYPPARVDETAFIRDWAMRNGYDPDKAVELAAEVVKSKGF